MSTMSHTEGRAMRQFRQAKPVPGTSGAERLRQVCMNNHVLPCARPQGRSMTPREAGVFSTPAGGCRE